MKEITQSEKEEYMGRALALAKKGEGYTSPNPMVGCVVVKDGRVISEGYHERYGGFHAERNALLRCAVDPAGADLYVTLEPCCHYGKTPPCTEIIIEKKIGRVFVGSLDSNPLVAGRGVRILQEAGIEVETGILEDACRRLNEVFYHYMEQKRPFTVLKYAMTLDGKIACVTGDSRWVSGEASREQVHALRKRYAGILVGIGTVLADDPMLNYRPQQGDADPALNPVRIVCDSALRIPETAKLVTTAHEIPTIVACRDARVRTSAQQEKIGRLRQAGVQVIITGADADTANTDVTDAAGICAGSGNAENADAGGGSEMPGKHTDLRELMQALAEQKIDSILVEGGASVHAAMLEAGLADKVVVYIAGKLVGGSGAPSPVGGAGIGRMADAVCLKDMQVERAGEDICVTGYLK